jgi:hypothetical protein
MGTLQEEEYAFFLLFFAQFFLEREMFQIKVVEKITTHILCSMTFPPENRAVYVIMCTNMVQPDRPQSGPCSLHAGQLRLQTHTQYVMFIAFPLKLWLHERASMSRYMHIAACLVITVT